MSTTLNKQLLWRGPRRDYLTAIHMAYSRAMLFMGQGADAREGIASFLEKRPPEFRVSVSKELPDVFPWWQPPQFG